eukprot:CAMPEP_0194031692 /NCGR_PEP_ID=MMETSP0009_2-20130614/4801_1 /TAXON_ID=210454 /ORGANISM="Grammatophora oceanica, Strain CCMP 410" /LENGTH=255 /DNA_ID=CAMNT_0038671913 /DNA_START=91 /DNA_END=859 /DNA_ORIENTATION=+
MPRGTEQELGVADPDVEAAERQSEMEESEKRASNVRDRLMQELIDCSGGKDEDETKDDEGGKECVAQEEKEEEDCEASSTGVDTDKALVAFANLVSDHEQVSFLDAAPRVVFAAMDSMKLGRRDQGSTSEARKFKSLTTRWYGVGKKTANKEESNSFNKVGRGTIVTIDSSDATAMYVVMAVFGLFYRKWVIAEDSPVEWDPEASSSEYKLSIRRVSRDMFSHYVSVDVNPPQTSYEDVYKVIKLHKVTSIVAHT